MLNAKIPTDRKFPSFNPSNGGGHTVGGQEGGGRSVGTYENNRLGDGMDRKSLN